MDDRVCPKHQGGKHCWHEYGTKSFRGKYESSSPVECCHCKRTAVRREHAAGWLEYDAVSASAEQK